MTKFMIFLLFTLALCAGGVYERMNDVTTMSLMSAFIFSLKIRQMYTRKVATQSRNSIFAAGNGAQKQA